MPEFLDNIKPGGQPDPPKRPQHPESYLTGVYKCGERREHLIRIHRSHWPPKTGANPMTGERNYVAGVCERCGGRAIVYDPVPSDMTVVLFGAASEAQGQVIEEPGEVVSEEDVPQAGQVIEEPEPRQRGRR